MKFSFKASLPPIQSAINLGGMDGDGARIKIDIPGTEEQAIERLWRLRGKVFRITIETEEED